MVFNCDELNTRDILLGNYNGANNVNFEVYSNNLFRLWWKGGTIDYRAPISLITNKNKLNLSVTLNKKDGTVNVYRNTELIGTITNENFTTYDFDYSPNVYLGRDNRSSSSSDFLKGVINAVRIYNRQLSENEIKNNYEIDKKRFLLID